MCEMKVLFIFRNGKLNVQCEDTEEREVAKNNSGGLNTLVVFKCVKRLVFVVQGFSCDYDAKGFYVLTGAKRSNYYHIIRN